MADDPNKRTDATDLSKLSSTSDVDTFLSRFNHENNYCDGTTKLHVGDTIIIIDGTYNARWIIAGFDCEHNRKASDGTVYDNGYGIILIPNWINLDNTKGYWNTDNTVEGGYKSSLAHSKTNTIATNMKNSILGTHLVNRNVLLSSAIDSSSGMSSAATWTTAYGTLPSVGQLFGIFVANQTIYDDGEANYKLPLYNYYIHFMSNSLNLKYDVWLRNIFKKEDSYYKVFYIDRNGNYNGIATNYTSKIYHPVLYIR